MGESLQDNTLLVIRGEDLLMAFQGMLRRYDCNKLKIHDGKCKTESERGDLIFGGFV